jgi:hypothetical protein
VKGGPITFLIDLHILQVL